MNAHDAMQLAGWLFVTGALFGVALGRAWRDSRVGVMKEEHNATVKLQGEEIARLRAQVANIIGKEKE